MKKYINYAMMAFTIFVATAAMTACTADNYPSRFALDDAPYYAEAFEFTASTKSVKETGIARVTLTEGGSYLIETIPDGGPGSVYEGKRHYKDEPESTRLRDYTSGKYTVTKSNAGSYTLTDYGTATLNGTTLTLTPKDKEPVTINGTVRTTTPNGLEIFRRWKATTTDMYLTGTEKTTETADEVVTINDCFPGSCSMVIREKVPNLPEMKDDQAPVSFIDVSSFSVVIIGYTDGYTDVATLTMTNGHNVTYEYYEPGMGYHFEKGSGHFQTVTGEKNGALECVEIESSAYNPYGEGPQLHKVIVNLVPEN